MTLAFDRKQLSRRSFLKGGPIRQSRVSENLDLPVLPWAASERIVEQCRHCEACITVCPQKIIVLNARGFPTVDFTRGDCTFCGDCVTVCPESVFNIPLEKEQAPWELKAEIGSDCFAKRGVQCQSCQDHCEPRAIQFNYRTGGISEPVILHEECTGCGACVSICPTAAITINPPTTRAIRKDKSG